MPRQFSISINEVVDLFSLEIKPNTPRNSTSYNIKCPFCNDNKYHCNINAVKNSYFCVLCSTPGESTGALDLYSRLKHGKRCVKGSNSKELYLELKSDLEGYKPDFKVNRNKAEVKEIYPACDSDLDRAYSALISLKYLALSRAHGENLLQRGLSSECIRRNQYASIRPLHRWLRELEQYDSVRGYYFSEELCSKKETMPKLKMSSHDEIIAGLIIAEDIVSKGISVDRVPGFFKLGNHWCFRLSEGMLIPTRNMAHQIVGLQIRRDEKTERLPRYMTVSSKGLPRGVTANIGRTHFPLANAELGENVQVFLTEGPLKADVSAHLLGHNSFFVAVQGVNNVKELPSIAKELKVKGASSIYNAYDMDKLTNMSVFKAVRQAEKTFAAVGISTNILFWDRENALKEELYLKGIFASHGIPWKETGNVFRNIYTACRELTSLHISYNYDSKRREKHNWNQSTKGIDDYLLNQHELAARQ